MTLAVASDPGSASAELGPRERHVRATVAARNGSIDDLVEPLETRDRLAWALARLEGTR